MSKASIPLNMIRVASPCHADWDDMSGNDQLRFCGQCSQHVYNLSAMTKEQAESLVMSTEGDLCVRFYRRTDGTMMTKDCPVGVAKMPMSMSVALAGLLIVFAFLVLGMFSLAGSRADEGGRRFTLQRALQWLFPEPTKDCVMGKR